MWANYRELDFLQRDTQRERESRTRQNNRETKKNNNKNI